MASYTIAVSVGGTEITVVTNELHMTREDTIHWSSAIGGPFGIRFDAQTPLDDQEFGFGTRGASYEYQFSENPSDQEAEKTMVTGDLNSALVEWVIQFTIDNPRDYLFKVRNPDDTLRDASESIMREFVGDRTVDEVITVGRAEIEEMAQEKLQEFANKYELGINITQFN